MEERTENPGMTELWIVLEERAMKGKDRNATLYEEGAIEGNREKVERMDRFPKEKLLVSGRIFAGVAMSALLGLYGVALASSNAEAQGAPPLPASIIKKVEAGVNGKPPVGMSGTGSDKAGPSSAGEAETVSGSAEKPAPAGGGVAPSAPAVRQAADDRGSELAAEVPAAEIGAAMEWLDQDVGVIATRPVLAIEQNTETAPVVQEEPKTIDSPVRALELAGPVPVEGEPDKKDLVAGEEMGREAKPVLLPEAEAGPGVAVAGQAESAITELEPASKETDQRHPILKATDGNESEEAVTAGILQNHVRPAADAGLRGLDVPDGGEATASVVAAPSTPKIVSIKANFTNKGGTGSNPSQEKTAASERVASPNAKAESGLDGRSGVKPQKGPVGSRGEFLLVWIDGDQRAGDTLVKFYEPRRARFSTGRECLEWAKSEALAGRAPNPAGSQPGNLSAACFGESAYNGEYWLWRQRSGAFVKSDLSEEQAELYRRIASRWMVASGEAYTTFPEVPVAGRE